MQSLWQDLRYGARMLLKKPGFTFIAVLTLALGIGANTAIFSVVNAVLLTPLPYRGPDRLVKLWETNVDLKKESENPSPGSFLDLREQKDVFDSVAAWYRTASTLQGEHDAEQVTSAQVSVEFFKVLGAQPARGRVFLPGEISGVARDSASQFVSGDRVAVISDNLWRRRYGAAPDFVGKKITINKAAWEVIGVMPPGFAMPSTEIDLWLPWDLAGSYNAQRFPAGPPRDWRFLTVVARLQSDVTIEQAQSWLHSFYAGLAGRHPKTNRGWDARLTPLYEEVVRKTKPALLLLFGAVALVLLIVCANLASLLLARAASRQRELGIRAALGGSRFRLVRQLLTESLLLALIGGTAGLILSVWGLELLISLAPADIPRLAEVAIDRRVLAFTLLISIMTGLAFGLIPALKSTQADPYLMLKEGGNRGAAASLTQRRFRNALVVAELALALVLLAGAGLMIRSFARIRSVDPGFSPQNLLTMHISLDGNAYRMKSALYYQQLIARLKSLPGVVSAAAVTTLPMSDVGVDFDRPYWRAGDLEPGGEADKVAVRMATPEYFDAIGVPILKGRNFTAEDRFETPAVLIVSESMAKKVWPGSDPIGKRLMLDYNRGKYSYEVVGVLRDLRYYGLKSEPKPELFIPHAQNPYLPMNVIVRTASDPLRFAGLVRREISALDPTQPVSHINTMEQLIGVSASTDRFVTWLIGLLAALALLLAVLGIYGVMSYLVSERTQEIGVRMALGAQINDVLWLVVKQGMTLAFVGLAIGLVAAFLLTRLLKTLLFGVSATDPLTFVLISLLLVGVALPACWIPALRAAKVDPMVALRYE